MAKILEFKRPQKSKKKKETGGAANQPEEMRAAFEQLLSHILEGEDPSKLDERFKNIPIIEMMESVNDFRIRVSLPGLEKDQVQVRARPNLVRIKLMLPEHNKEVIDPKRSKPEGHMKTVSQTIPLPAAVEANAIKAKYEEGMLDIRLPKKIVRDEDLNEVPIE